MHPPDISPRVRYHLPDRDEPVPPERLPSDADVRLAELHYPCPACDHPNIAAVTPPLTHADRDRCDACGEDHDLTDSLKELPIGIEADIREIEDAADRLHQQRRARLAGHDVPEAIHRRVDRAAKIASGALLVAVLPAAIAFTALALFLSGLIYPYLTGLLPELVAGLTAFTTGIFGAVLPLSVLFGFLPQYLLRRHRRRLYGSHTSDERATAALSHGLFVDHARRVDDSDEDASLEIPTETNPDHHDDLLLDVE